MARLVFPDEGSRLAYDPDTGRLLTPGTRVYLYLDQSATQAATDLLNADASPNATGFVQLDAYRRLPLFSGPDDGSDTLYAVINGGPATPVYAREDDRIDGLASRVTAVESTAGAAIPASQKAAPNGVATLDGSGAVPDGQIPAGIARDSEVAAAVAALVAGAPGALDTLNELAAALGDDASFAATVTNALAAKADQTDLDTLETSLPATFAAVSLQGSRKIESAPTTITPGGSWCQFCGPAAVDFAGSKKQRYLGWTAADGGIIVASVDLVTGAVQQFNLHPAFPTVGVMNDHTSPSLVVHPDGRITAMYAQQGGGLIYARTTTNPEDVTAWAAEVTITAEEAQYPRPHYIGNRLFLIYSGSPQWRIRYSDDHGVTWSSAQNWIDLNPNPGGYVQTRSNGSRIDFIFSMHPNSSGAGYASLSSMYHGYFDGTTFRKTDGTALVTLAALPAYDPVLHPAGTMNPTALNKVYDYTTNGVCWALDVALDSAGNPVAAFVSYPNVVLGDDWTVTPAHFVDQRYNYYRWNGAAWVGAQVTTSRKMTSASSSADRAEYVYSGGMNLLQSDPTVVYLSRPEGPASQFEIERWVTPDGYGATWLSTSLTVESPARSAQIRPLTPANPIPGAPDVAWLSGFYYNYISYAVVPTLASPLGGQTQRSLLARPLAAGQVDVLVAAAKAAAPDLLLPMAGDLGDTSGTGTVVVPHAVPVYGKGRYGDRKALTFDGSTQSIATTVKPFAAGAVLTFFGWANRANHAAGHVLFGSDDSGGGSTDCGLRLNTGGQNVQFWANLGASAGAGSVNWVNAWPGDGQWAHWALIADMTAQTVELFINGVSLGVNAYTTNWGAAGNYLQIGQNASFLSTNPTGAFNGSMTVVGYKAGRLTAAQIAAMAGVVTGDRGGNTVVTSLLSVLAAAGQIGSDKTTDVPSSAATPTVAVGVPAGTGATVGLLAGSTDRQGQIQLTTGTGPTVGAVVALTFGAALAAGLHPLVIVQLEWTTGVTTHTVKAISVGNTGFSVYSGNVLPASSPYKITYRVLGAL
jgi:hypothetical protein